MSALGTHLCAACDVDLHEMCGGGCTCGCHDRTPQLLAIKLLPTSLAA